MRTTDFTNIHTMKAQDLPAVLYTTKAPEDHHTFKKSSTWVWMALHYEANGTGNYFSKVGLSFTASLRPSFSLCISEEGLGPI